MTAAASATRAAKRDADQMAEAMRLSVEDEEGWRLTPAGLEAMAADATTTAQAAHSHSCFICMEEPLTANEGGLATVSHVDRDWGMTCPHKVCSNCAPGYLHNAQKQEDEWGFEIHPKKCVTVLEPPNRTRPPEPGTSARSLTCTMGGSSVQVCILSHEIRAPRRRGGRWLRQDVRDGKSDGGAEQNRTRRGTLLAQHDPPRTTPRQPGGGGGVACCW